MIPICAVGKGHASFATPDGSLLLSFNESISLREFAIVLAGGFSDRLSHHLWLSCYLEDELPVEKFIQWPCESSPLMGALIMGELDILKFLNQSIFQLSASDVQCLAREWDAAYPCD